MVGVVAWRGMARNLDPSVPVIIMWRRRVVVMGGHFLDQYRGPECAKALLCSLRK
jgi:hypothetical protein